MTARWPAASNCRRPAGSGATACACTARSIRPASRRWRRASRSTASPTARSAPRSTGRRDRTPGSTLSLQEGKNREVRRVLEHLGLSGDAADPGRLRPVPARPSGRGEIEEVPAKVLREQLGGLAPSPVRRQRGMPSRVGRCVSPQRPRAVARLRSRAARRRLSRLAVPASLAAFGDENAHDDRPVFRRDRQRQHGADRDRRRR